MGDATNVDTDDIRTNEADDRGRIYLGTEYADKRVTVAVVEVEPDGPDEDSSVRLDQIRVVSIGDRIHAVVGRLGAETMRAVDRALESSLGLV